MSSVVYFERCMKGVYPFLQHDDVIEWHFRHGWVWNLWDIPRKNIFGCCYCTLLCGSGCVLHFRIAAGVRLSAGVILAAMRKGISLAVKNCDVVYATIPRSKTGLIRVVQRLGFKEVVEGGFESGGEYLLLLKYAGEK